MKRASDLRRASNGTLLCIGHLRDDIVRLHQVAERASLELGFDPRFLVTAPERFVDEPRRYLAAHHLREVDRVVEHAAYYDPPASPALPYAMRRVRGLRRASNKIARYQALRTANLELARRILDVERPAGVVATVDACHDLLLAEATRRGIPTVYMQVALWGDRTFYRRLWAQDERATANHVVPRRRFATGIDKAVQRGFGLQKRPAWWRDSSRIAVLGQYWADLLIRGGVPRNRIAVTGNPVCDEIHRVRFGCQGRWEELYARLGLPRGTRYFLHCREHHGRFTTLANGASQAAQREIIQALKSASPETPIVVKMHPRDTPDEYTFVRSIDPAVIAVGSVPLIELLAQSLLMVTTTSTTQLWSAALDRPTISAFLWKGLDHWERATAFSGVERVFTPQQLRSSVGRYLTDPGYQTLWRQKRQAFVAEMLMIDGHSADRVVELLRQPLHQQGT